MLILLGPLLGLLKLILALLPLGLPVLLLKMTTGFGAGTVAVAVTSSTMGRVACTTARPTVVADCILATAAGTTASGSSDALFYSSSCYWYYG